MVHDPHSALSRFVNELIEAGRCAFTGEEARAVLGLERVPLIDAIERLQRCRSVISPRRGFYVVVPPEFESWGAPPPAWYIDALMKHEAKPYYVGLLKASELHGASHQAVMEFQVVTEARIPTIRVGRSRIRFYFRKKLDSASLGLQDRITKAGRMKVSSPALTALDLLRYPHATGGIDNVATVLSELAERIDPGELTELSRRAERSVAQRLGYLLEQLGHGDLTAGMLLALTESGKQSWTEFDRSELINRNLRSGKIVRDKRWRVIVRRAPDPDD